MLVLYKMGGSWIFCTVGTYSCPGKGCALCNWHMVLLLTPNVQRRGFQAKENR
jgi:hypothetical protein